MKLVWAMGVAAVSGFLALSYEMLWYRVIAYVTWGVASSFGLLLAAYLVGIAVGSRVSAVLCRGPGRPSHVRALALFVALANVLSALVIPAFAVAAKSSDTRWGLLAVGVGAALMGSVLPLVSHFGIDPDERAGSRMSYVYVANIGGSAAGSLLTGLYLLDQLTLTQIATLLALIGFGLAASILVMARGRAVVLLAGIAAASLAGVGAIRTLPPLYDRVWERLTYKGKDDGKFRFAEVVENKHGVITVTPDGIVYGGGAYDGVFNTSIAADRNGIVRAYGIGALHPAPREVLMIGLASGSWGRVVSSLPGVEHMTIVEINPGYRTIVARHPEVRDLLDDPKVTLVFDDGRRWLRRHPDRRFDVVVMNTTWHWRAHATNLLSREFFGMARAHLRPGGLFYFNTTSSDDVQRTAASTFAHALRVMNFIAVSDVPFSWDRARWRALLSTVHIGGKPAIDLRDDDGKRTLEELVGYDDLEERESILARTQGARIVTDDNMVPEWREPLRYPGPP